MASSRSSRWNCWNTKPSLRLRTCGERVRIHGGDGFAVEAVGARGRPVEAADHIHEGGFAGTGRAHHRDELAGIDFQIHVEKRMHGLVAEMIKARELLDFDQRHLKSRSAARAWLHPPSDCRRRSRRALPRGRRRFRSWPPSVAPIRTVTPCGLPSLPVTKTRPTCVRPLPCAVRRFLMSSNFVRCSALRIAVIRSSRSWRAARPRSRRA